jgi:acyl dehydratase
MNLEKLRAYRIAPLEQRYSVRESMLYALSLGYGTDPLDREQLKFVYEQGEAPLRVVPSQCVVLAHPGFWARDPVLEIDWVKLLHGEHSFEIHRPLPPEGTVRGEYEIVAVEDKGVGKGAIIHQEKRLFDVTDNALLATVRTVLFCRGDGGCGSFGVTPPGLEALPEGAPSASVTLTTSPQSALLYRLNGDFNPIHADPDAAARGGLGRPILHGLCTLGVAVRAAITELAAGVPERIRSVSLRFSKPVYPGETLRIELFGNRFRAVVVEREAVVLDRGTVVLF